MNLNIIQVVSLSLLTKKILKKESIFFTN